MKGNFDYTQSLCCTPKGKSVFARTKRAIQLQLRGAAALARAQKDPDSTVQTLTNPVVRVQRVLRALEMALRPEDHH